MSNLTARLMDSYFERVHVSTGFRAIAGPRRGGSARPLDSARQVRIACEEEPHLVWTNSRRFSDSASCRMPRIRSAARTAQDEHRADGHHRPHDEEQGERHTFPDRGPHAQRHRRDGEDLRGARDDAVGLPAPDRRAEQRVGRQPSVQASRAAGEGPRGQHQERRGRQAGQQDAERAQREEDQAQEDEEPPGFRLLARTRSAGRGQDRAPYWLSDSVVLPTRLRPFSARFSVAG